MSRMIEREGASATFFPSMIHSYPLLRCSCLLTVENVALVSVSQNFCWVAHDRLDPSTFALVILSWRLLGICRAKYSTKLLFNECETNKYDQHLFVLNFSTMRCFEHPIKQVHVIRRETTQG